MHPCKKPTTIVEPTTTQLSSFDFSHAIAQEHFLQRGKATVGKGLKQECLIFTPTILVRIGMSEKPGLLAHPCRMGKRKSPPWSTANSLM